MATLAQSTAVCYALGIHRAPASASIPEFARLMDGLIDELNALPVVQENYLTVDMILPTDKADKYIPALGLAPRPPVVVFPVKAKTPEHIHKVLASPEARKVFQKGTDFGNQSSIFAYKIVAKIDRPAPNNGVQLVFIYDAPLELATSENHIREFNEFIDGFVLLPGVQKNSDRLELWQPTDILDQHVQDFGYSTERRPTICITTFKDLDTAKQMLADPATQRYFAGAAEDRQQFDSQKYGYAFVANVVTKHDNTNK
ncbi:hypothetical protein R3P38DRAFT_3464514 [Favolaschia claudopus]|uniref:Uncharacterized protein n=1 Tax=Favolaschia claudopus TaxID=2862362 RepID=A0AAV9ZFW7_9AGAR